MELVRVHDTCRRHADHHIRNVLMITFGCFGILFHTIGFGKSLNSAVRNEHVCRPGRMYL